MANIDKINQVLESITAENLDMAEWGRKASCGTVMCFAGHTVANEGLEIEWNPIDYRYDPMVDDYVPTAWSAEYLTDGRRIENVAREILDLDSNRAHAIFYATTIGSDVQRLREHVDSVLKDPEYDYDDDRDYGDDY